MSRNVVVIGAGVVGLSVALACARRGWSVTVVERQGPSRSGCSYGNAGMVVPSHFIPLAAPGMMALGLKWMWNPESPFYIKPRWDVGLFHWGWRFCQAANAQAMAQAAPLLRDLNLASHALFESWAAEGLDFGWQPRGLLMLCRTDAALREEAHTAAQARALGLEAEVLDAPQVAAQEPDVDLTVKGAVLFPQDGTLEPERLMATLEAQSRAAGVVFHWQTEVTGWKRNGPRVAALRTPQGDIEGDEFVLCAGVWSEALARSLGLRLPLQAGKGYSLTLPQPPQRLRHGAILVEDRVAVTPMGTAMRFGGTMELAGADESLNLRRVNGIIRAAGRYLPAFHAPAFEGIPPWSGLRPCTPDGLPYLGRTGAATNLYLATGHAMMGVSLAPVTGALIAQILAHEPPTHDVRLLSPDRFA